MMKVLFVLGLATFAMVSAQHYDSDGFYSGEIWNPLPPNYPSMSAKDKAVQLTNQLVATNYQSHNKPLPKWNGQGFLSLLKDVADLLNLKTVFDDFSDIIDTGRSKAIHTLGVVAPFTFTPAKSTKYTGIFKEGGHGFARMSLGGDPSKIAILPGIAWKFLVDSHPSVNVVSNWDLDGQGNNTNFFLHHFRSWLPPPKSLALKVLSYWFSRTEKDPGHLPVNELAQKMTDGTTIMNPVSPNILLFKQTAAYANLIPSDSPNDFRDNLQKLPVGHFMDVYACSTMEETENPSELIGTITLEKSPVASFFGDARLYYRHQSKFARP